MYPSKGSGGFGQQSYAGQQGFGQIPGAGFSGKSGGDVGSQHSMASQQSSMMGGNQDVDVSGFRTSSSQGAQYGGTYASVYGSAALGSTHQVAGVSGKGGAPSGLQGRMTYPSSIVEPSKFSSGSLGSSLGMSNDDYVSASNRGYAQKGEQFPKSSDYASMDRRQYSEHQAAYIGRELQSDSARRYADPVSLSQQHQGDMHDLMDQASLLRQQQMLKAQSLQSGSNMRQTDYLAARAAPIHHASQDFGSYGGRMDVDPRSLPILGSTPYGGQHAASILGGAPRRNADDLYAQGSSSAAYGVGLPPGRDYIAGKGLHGPIIEADYQGNVLSRGHPSLGVSMIDERKDDRSAYRREMELRDEERRRELMREREKEREREERERQRDRERERDRLIERRDRERERDRKREPDSRRERTPPRASRDRRGSSSMKDERPPRRASPRRASPRRASPRRVSPRRASPRRASPRRVSPRREAVHRRRSPVKEKKREYICKVYPFCLVDVERDYLSLSKRYPRLSISPDCSKVVLRWPKENMHLSLYTPVSFEHEFTEVDNKGEEKGLVPSGDLPKSKCGGTVWNAKVILMSGISGNALNDMCSYKSSDERIIHFNNILRFAVLKKDRAFMAFGGPWNMTMDGGDPSVDVSSLIQTARRYVKDVTQLDLQNCRDWNPFLEIHYDRVGEDGLFSHKEITVLFVPDLSECLPSLDSWRSQWLAHKKDVAERERQLAANQEKKSSESKEPVQENVKAEDNLGKDVKIDKTDKHSPILAKESDTKADDTQDSIGQSKKGNVVRKGKGPVLDEIPLEENAAGAVDGDGEIDGANADSQTDVQKPGKKKVIKKVVKGKVAGKKATEATMEDATAKTEDKVDVKDGDKQVKSENAVKEEQISADVAKIKTFVRKKIVKNVPAGKTPQKVDSVVHASTIENEKKPEKEKENEDASTVEKKESDGTAAVQETGLKTTGKKKVIRRVIKRKVPGSKGKDVNAIKKDVEEDANTLQKVSKEEEIKEQIDKKGEESKEKMPEESKALVSEREGTKEKKIKSEKEIKKEGKVDDTSPKSDKGVSKSSTESEVTKNKDTDKDGHDGKRENAKDEKEKKSKDGRHEPKDTKQKSHKEGKEKGKPEEPPKHPGLFLQPKQSKESRIRSMSLTLGGLLDYNDKDIEESTFELSLFAESLNEMLQYQMGCRLLSFLEKLRRKFVVKKNQRKRQRDEKSEKESEKDSSVKRLKVNEDSSVRKEKVNEDSSVEKEPLKSGAQDSHNQNHVEAQNDDGSASGPGESKMEHESDDEDVDYEEEEDPEEIIEDDQEMDDAAPSDDGVQEDESAAKTADINVQAEKASAREDESKKTLNEKSNSKTETKDEKHDEEKKEDDRKSETKKADSVNEESVDKELLQAFRYFDYNRVGYIKVEDLRCLLHNLGLFLSHRDVKELVQSALFESNTARDNRIFYKKLVKLTDI